MKTIFRFTILLLAIGLQTCSEETVKPEKIQFTFNLTSNDVSGGRLNFSLPEGTSLLISVQTAAGEPVLTLERVALISFSGGYITEPLEMAPGSYKLSDFMIVNEAMEVLYATPLKGSPLAGAVSRPLPFNFSLSKNKVASIDMELIDVSHSAPEDLGYVSFDINIVHPLRLSLFKNNDGNVSLTSGTGYLLKDGDTLQTFKLSAKVNLLSFKQDPDETYTLVVIKDGYSRFTREFVYNDLMEELDNDPLQVILVPALTMLAYLDADISDIFQFALIGQADAGSITIDWGDGTPAQNIGIDTERVEIAHGYATPGNYFVSATGDLDKITYFYSFYGQGMIDQISFEHLTDLNELRFGLTRGPEVIDLTHNTKLEMLLMPGIDEVKVLKLPENHLITFMNISGMANMPTASIDAIIDNLYNSVTTNVRTGSFEFSTSWYEEEGPIGPPSPDAVNKLRILRDSYGWSIYPNL